LGAVWVATNDGLIARIDPATSKVAATCQTPSVSWGVAIGEGTVWAVNGHGVVSRIDPTINEVVATIQVGQEGADQSMADIALSPNTNNLVTRRMVCSVACHAQDS
jgi:streptogramin lyase